MMDDETRDDLVRQLTEGFSVLLQQAEELHRRNAELELLLAQARGEVGLLYLLENFCYTNEELH